jgi:hypothetical protein
MSGTWAEAVLARGGRNIVNNPEADFTKPGSDFLKPKPDFKKTPGPGF